MHFVKFSEGVMYEYMDTEATKEAVFHGRATISSTLGEFRYNMFTNKVAAGLVKLTEGAAAQHSICAYLQTMDRIILQRMSLEPQ